MMASKAMRSVIIIKFLIKIQVGTSFLQKYKFNFDAIYSVSTEYSKNLFLTPKQGFLT